MRASVTGSGLYFFQYLFLEGVESHCAQVAALAGADGYNAVFNVAVAYDQHIGDTLELCFAYLIAQLFVAVINFYTQTKLVKLGSDIVAYLGGTVGKVASSGIITAAPFSIR